VTAAAPAVVMSYGMGTDSTALLLRWLLEPATRPCDLSELAIITAQTGDEWSATGQLVTRYVLPLMRDYGLRFAQVARKSRSQADGIAVLDDTRHPERLHLEGAYKLSQELIAGGTVPHAGGARRCSAKAKGWPLDQFIREQTNGQPYLHVVGFEANETGRALRDAGFNTELRTGSYPLIEWGWQRADCERYIEQHLHVQWIKSACTYCPFALLNKGGRRRVMDMYQAEPETGGPGLLMEHLAVSLNPRQGLMAGRRLADLLANSPAHAATMSLFRARLDADPWNVYEVRRALRPNARCLRIAATGSRADMSAELARLARAEDLSLTADDGIARAWLRRRGPVFPTAEHFYVAAPAGASEKEGRGFATAWAAALQAPAQLDLFDRA
jgi:hypothetical protein